MGVTSCILGYANEKINKEIKKALDASGMCTLNALEEFVLAKNF